MSSFRTEGRPAAQLYLRRFALPLPLLFGLTILSSACLLFLVQPLISKLILPWFGGSSAIWITCMLFFQAGLLLGYAYAHTLASKLTFDLQASLHTALLVASLLSLPILPNPRWQPGPGQDPTWRVLAALATSVGLPYLALSSTSPLLQSWYASTNRGSLPYRYFALSNAGSLAALLLYPVAIEPFLSGHQQAILWSVAFVIGALLCAFSAALAGTSAVSRPSLPEEASPSAHQILLWLSLSACASTLLLTVTNLLTQNIAPMPLLWVLPLAVYLFTFILCFESDRWYRRGVFLPLLMPALGALAAASGPLENDIIAILIPLCLAALFVCCMTCHGELSRMRPPASHLTSFYLCLSAGGALGGLFVALLAPRIFPAPLEIPVSFVACAALLLVVFWRKRPRWSRPTLGLPLWLAALASTLVLVGYLTLQTRRTLIHATLLARNFYGALRVDDFIDHNRPLRELSHGTITHGVQFLTTPLRHQPTSYYARDSGIGLTWRTLASAGPLRMGVIGLGAGTLAAYGRPADSLRFYDINPLILDIAKSRFTYLSDSPAHIDTVLGDARLSLAHEPPQNFDILVIDAFSGDSIPVHLLTREAFQLYWHHLKPDGVLAIHISNHYLDLAPVVMLNAKAFGKEAWEVDSETDELQQIFASSYVLVTSRPNFFKAPGFRGQLIQVDVPPGLRLWTDDYSNLWQVLKWKGNEE